MKCAGRGLVKCDACPQVFNLFKEYFEHVTKAHKVSILYTFQISNIFIIQVTDGLFQKLNKFKPNQLVSSKKYTTADESLKKAEYFKAKKKKTAMLQHQAALNEYYYFPVEITKTEEEMFSPHVKAELKRLITQDLFLSGSGKVLKCSGRGGQRPRN